MVVDVAPKLLEEVETKYKERTSSNSKLAKLNLKIDNGRADYTDADEYADIIAEILNNIYDEVLTKDALPNGILYYNIANRVIRPTVKKAYDDVAAATARIQESLNKKAGFGLKGIPAEISDYRLDQLIEKVLKDV